MTRRSTTWTWIGILSLATFLAPLASSAEWKAGIAKTSITPKKYIWMSGYGSRNRPAEAKLTDLWAKVLVLEDAKSNKACLITLDLVGIGRRLSDRICNSLKSSLGLKRDQIAICTSHTHTGPVVGKNLAPLHYYQISADQQKAVDDYANELHDKIVELVEQAASDMTPHVLQWGSGRCSVAVNRRENREAEVPKIRAANKLNGPLDHDVPVLSVRNAADNKLSCVVFGYACHATVLSFYQWSGDYPGFAQMALEELQPGCQAMFWAGCGADQNPLPRRKVELAKSYGTRLAYAVNEVLQAKMKPLDSLVETQYRNVDIPLAKLPTRAELEESTKSKNRFEAARARMLINQIDNGEPLGQTYSYPIQTWVFNDEVQFVVLGGEVVVDYAVRLKLEAKGTSTWVAGYSNDVMAYIPSRRVLREGGYEGATSMVYYGLPTIWAPEIENLIVNEVHRQLKEAAK